MKQFRFLPMAFIVAALAIGASTALLAQEADAAKAVPVNNASAVPRVSEAGFARELASNGRQLQDAYLLIQSAELLIMAGKLPGPPAEVKDAKPGSEKRISLDPAGLLRESARIAGARGDHHAIEMAAELARNAIVGLGNDALADEISKTEVERGYSKGNRPKEGSACLHSGEIANQEFTFNKNEYAEIRVFTGDYLPVDVYVSDKNGLVNSDDTPSALKTVAWQNGSDRTLKVAIAANYGATCYGFYVP